ncbi:YraN family protein [Oleiagrimonas sp.]|jgi:putative endonuclease|uniref:YraN family protein n=1 Tax=Oleiagrimonas sp. TaxID=2010330 RepID=UPI0026052834|nr:YraN family protein [Oleiagrimonas sp.]MDA3914899.1 YraN family protein [Oleiagrimonas sp.]
MGGTGDVFEDRALAHLERAGLTLLERNFRTRFGELDLIMRDGATLVFVEVRYRRSRSHGGAAMSVTARKRERLTRAAEGYLAAHPAHASRACRFDVIAFEGPPEEASVDWQRAAFDAHS